MAPNAMTSPTGSFATIEIASQTTKKAAIRAPTAASCARRCLRRSVGESAVWSGSGERSSEDMRGS